MAITPTAVQQSHCIHCTWAKQRKAKSFHNGFTKAFYWYPDAFIKSPGALPEMLYLTRLPSFFYFDQLNITGKPKILKLHDRLNRANKSTPGLGLVVLVFGGSASISHHSIIHTHYLEFLPLFVLIPLDLL